MCYQSEVGVEKGRDQWQYIIWLKTHTRHELKLNVPSFNTITQMIMLVTPRVLNAVSMHFVCSSFTRAVKYDSSGGFTLAPSLFSSCQRLYQV